MKRKGLLFGLLMCVFYFFVTPAVNANNLYEVNRSVSGTDITGYIETDGVLDSLDSSSVVNWYLEIHSFFGPTTDIMNPSNSDVFVSGRDLQATGTELSFDFDQPDEVSFFLTAAPAGALMA